jgi:hypothetical protein
VSGKKLAANGLQLPEGREFENEITLKKWKILLLFNVH